MISNVEELGDFEEELLTQRYSSPDRGKQSARRFLANPNGTALHPTFHVESPPVSPSSSQDSQVLDKHNKAANATGNVVTIEDSSHPAAPSPPSEPASVYGFVKEFQLLPKMSEKLATMIGEYYRIQLAGKGLTQELAERKFLEKASLLPTYGIDPFVTRVSFCFQIFNINSCKDVVNYLLNSINSTTVNFFNWKSYH